MKMMKKEFYNPEKEITEEYTEKWIIEKSRVKEVNDLLVTHHYWMDSDGELWGDFDNPMENVKLDFDAYRERNDFMKPEEIKKLQNDLKLNVREFAGELGLGYANLNQIENNQRVQTKYQDRLFKLARDKYNATGDLFGKDLSNDFIELINKELAQKSEFSDSLIDESEKYKENTNKFSLYNYVTLGDAA